MVDPEKSKLSNYAFMKILAFSKFELFLFLQFLFKSNLVKTFDIVMLCFNNGF